MVPNKNKNERLHNTKQSRFHSGVGILLYLVKHSRPDISNCVGDFPNILDSSCWNPLGPLSKTGPTTTDP